MEKTNEDSISLNKYISNTGICSRREADSFIKAGRVKINQKVAQLGNRVFEGDIVLLDGKALKVKPKALYIAFNKPVGIVCTTDLKEPKNIIDYINHKERLFPIGRLDKPSEGLIFLTNDGDIVNKILRAGNRHEKEYLVTVKQAITPHFIRKMSFGIPILNTVTKKCRVEQLSKHQFRIILTQGLNRQIRRMCNYLDYDVVKLKRVRIMNVRLGKLRTGTWRVLTKEEMLQINKSIKHSSKTEEASVDRNKVKKR
jgi:23S rRNA pseudouridine2604 synthase